MSEQTEQQQAPGRDLDVAVARAMGVEVEREEQGPGYQWIFTVGAIVKRVPSYSTDYAALGEMLDWLKRGGGVVTFGADDDASTTEGWYGEVYHAGRPIILTKAPTLPHAVALLVLEVAKA